MLLFLFQMREHVRVDNEKHDNGNRACVDAKHDNENGGCVDQTAHELFTSRKC